MVLITLRLSLNIVPLACLVIEIGQELAFLFLESFRSSVWVHKIGIGIRANVDLVSPFDPQNKNSIFLQNTCYLGFPF